MVVGVIIATESAEVPGCPRGLAPHRGSKAPAKSGPSPSGFHSHPSCWVRPLPEARSSWPLISTEESGIIGTPSLLPESNIDNAPCLSVSLTLALRSTYV